MTLALKDRAKYANYNLGCDLCKKIVNPGICLRKLHCVKNAMQFTQ